MSFVALVVVPLVFAAAPQVNTSEASPTKLMPAGAIGGIKKDKAGYQRFPNPEECIVVIDGLGNLGYRIADGQALTAMVMTEMRSRVGRGGVVFEGTLLGDKKMTRMLAGSETPIRSEKMAYYSAAIENAERRVKIKFGRKNKRDYIVVSCRNAGEKKNLDVTRVTGSRFPAARKKLKAALPAFCLQIATKKVASTVETPVIKKKKKKKAFEMPPRR